MRPRRHGGAPSITEQHLDEAPYIGALFLALELVLVASAVLLLRRDRTAVWVVAGLSAGAAIGAYVLSRSIGLPQITDDVGKWTEPLGVVALGSETALVLLTAAAVLTRRDRPVAAPGSVRWPYAASAAVLVLGLTATADATAAEDGSGHGAMVGMSQGNYWQQVGGGNFHPTGVTRTYYISADLVEWNYAPDGTNDITGKPFDDVANTHVGSGPGRIGSRYVKCLYRACTDNSFRHLQRRAPQDAYLGMLGPVIRATVGDTIKVNFRNSCPFATSVHPHGVFYTKSSEGAPYNDGTSGADKADDAVPTGGRHSYTWLVPDRAGPGPNDGSSVMWMYHSHTDEVADTYAGLIGPMVITRKGSARADGSPKDVDRELFTTFFIDNEALSPLLDTNMKRFGTPPLPSDPTSDENFVESNLKHSINGYLYGNMPMIDIRRGQHVRWYVMAMGTETDLHTPHWHGNDVLVNGMRMDVVSLLPASMITADMVPDNPGTWLFHCHVNDHLTAGMITRYRVS